MDFIDEAHRHQNQADPNVRLLFPEVVDGEKLGGDGATSARSGVFEFDFRVEDPVVVEFVADVEDRA